MKIFHHTDNDGLLSAAIVKKKFPNSVCVPYNYKGQFPWHLIEDKEEIFIVDLSFKNKSQFNDILKKTKNITWIDHHISSIKVADKSIKGVRVNHIPSACVLCWEYLFQDKPMPDFVSIISDYDTWTHKFGEKTILFNLAMTLYTEVDQWGVLLDSPPKINEKVKEGGVISRYLNQYYKTLSKEVIFNTVFHGHKVAVCNVCGLGALSLKYWEDEREIKSTFYFDGTFYHVSLYSETVNCAHIAEHYGGGGHFSAAGFRTLEFPFKEEGRSGIYKIEFIPEGKIYIGSTTDSFRKRFLKHKRRLKSGTHENNYLQNYWNKYGGENFRFDIIELCNSVEKTLERENFWLKHYFSKGKDYCFNLSDHVMGGNTLKTPEIKLKHSLGLKRSYTPELRERRRLDGLKRSEEARVTLQKAMKTGLWKDNHRRGVQNLAKKQSWLAKVRKNNEKRMKKVKTNLGEIFESISQASRKTGAHPSNIRLCIKGKIKTCMGRKWQYC